MPKIKATLPKKHTRSTIRNAIRIWSDMTNNHPFTAIDLRNSGVVDTACETVWKKQKAKVPNGVNISLRIISCVCGSLEREGYIALVHHNKWSKTGRCKQWLLNGSGIV